MKHNCFLQGHKGNDKYNWRENIAETCIYCGKHPKEGHFFYDYEEQNLFHRLWDDHLWFQIPVSIIIGCVALFLIFILFGLIMTPIASLSCDAKTVPMGLQHYYNFWAGCMVNYKDFGWIPFDKLFLLMGH